MARYATQIKINLRDGPAVAYVAAITRCGGSAIVEEVQHELQQRNVDVALPSMRVALQRLRDRELISARTIAHGRSNRVRYRITGKGRQLLRRWQQLLGG